MSWIDDTESIIYTTIKTEFPEDIAAEYPNLFFTTSNQTDSNAVFPTVYIHQLSGAERGRDLEGTAINAVYTTIQVDVICNTSQSDASVVMSPIVDIMKQMMFNVNPVPEFTTSGDTYRATARFSRTLCDGDI